MTEPNGFQPDWVFAPGDTNVDPNSVIRTIPEIPDGLGPVIGSVILDDTPSPVQSGATLASGTAQFSSTTVFRLAEPGGAPQTWSSGSTMPVAAIRELGSQSLAAALTAGDMADVLDAMADDVVLVPVLPGPDGGMETRLFNTPDDDGTPDFCLFSSADTMERFLGHESGAYFIIQHGAAVVAFLSQHLDDVADLVIDPAGPSALRVPVATMVGFLDFTPIDPDMLEALSAQPNPATDVTAFQLRLDGQWGRIDCTDPVRREEQIKSLVATQTRTLDDRSAAVRRDMRTWLSRAAEKAASSNGTRMYFLLTRTRDAAAALSVVSYFHDFGQETGGTSHLNQVADYLLGKAGPNEEVFRINVAGDTILRHTHLGHGNEDLGASEVPLLNIDYWIPAPDRHHMAHVCFSSPHVVLKEPITQLADNVVFNGVWVPADTESEQPDTSQP